MTVVLQAVRSSLILTAEQDVTAAELSPVKTVQRLTVQLLMQHVMLQRTLLQQVWQTNVRSSFLMRSVLHILHLSTWKLLEQVNFLM